ncbi:MAG: DUF3048 domain-containing protein, partial [Candidatus Saccharimonadales bacterium]
MRDDIRETVPKPDNLPPKEKQKFLTPEEAAVKDSKQADVSRTSDLVINMEEEEVRKGSNTTSGANKTLLGNSARTKSKRKFLHLSKKAWLISGGVTLVVLIIACWLAYLAVNHKPLTLNIGSNKPKSSTKSTTTSSTVASTLTGLQVAPSVNQHPITAVMVENTPDARPQSGLSQAGVVFEALAEGGVTRFMALFQDQLPTYVGPVRSARPYFIDWALGFDAPYAHVGGSPDALSEIKSFSVKDMDYMTYPSYYTR